MKNMLINLLNNGNCLQHHTKGFKDVVVVLI